MDLSQKIVTARKTKGLTQEQLADSANVTVRTIQRIESGESIPRSYTLKTIATVLDTSFEELAANTESSTTVAADSLNLPTASGNEDGKHFLQILCLSCFSYIVIPFIHFLVPAWLLKRSKPQNPTIIAFARKVIIVQVYWLVALHSLLLLTLGYNLIRAAYFQKTMLVNYLWPFLAMYFLNIIIIIASILRIKKTNFSFQPAA